MPNGSVGSSGVLRPIRAATCRPAGCSWAAKSKFCARASASIANRPSMGEMIPFATLSPGHNLERFVRLAEILAHLFDASKAQGSVDSRYYQGLTKLSSKPRRIARSAGDS